MRLIVFLLPLVLYFLAELFAGAAVAMCVGVVTSVVMAIVESRRGGRRIDYVSLGVDILLIVAFGVSDIYIDTIDEHLRPVVMSGLLVVLLAFSLIPRFDLLGGFSEKLNPSTSKNPYLRYLIVGSQRRMLVWAAVAFALYLYAYMQPDTHAARWIDSYLIITMMLAYLATEIVMARIRRRKYSKCEWVMMVDEEGNPTGGCPRPLVHNGSKWLHAVVHLHVVSGGRLLLQLRPKTKKIQGGKWDTAVGGHVSAGEKLETALARETAEEIGLTQFDAKLVGRYVWRSEVESEYVFQFVTQSSGPFNPQNVGEVDELKFWTHAELESALGKGVLTPNLENELKAGLLDTLKNY